jgi:hypothetical protein
VAKNNLEFIDSEIWFFFFKFSKIPRFYTKFMQVAKSVEGWINLFFFQFYSQIWLDHLLDDSIQPHHTIEKKNTNHKTKIMMY